MKEQTRREYNKTWYHWITFPWMETPKNWISGRKIDILGLRLVLWHVAKKNYKWNKE